MSVFSVKLKLLGEMSQLPDSQRLFGALVYMLKEYDSDNAASEFVQSVSDKSLDFNLSGVLPKNYMPTPKSYLERIAAKIGGNGRDIYRKVKEKDFVPKDVIQSQFTGDSDTIEKSANYFSLITDQQVHVNQEKDDGNENAIFSVQKTLVVNQNDEPVEPKLFEFFFACDDSCAIKTMLDEKEGYIFRLGKRSSQGYNLFELTGNPTMSEMPQESSQNIYLNLGMLLPDTNVIDFRNEHSSLDIFTSQRRPYKMPGAWHAAEGRGHFISFVAPGSIVVTQDPVCAGKCVGTPFDEKAIVFGRSFLYPLEVK